MKEYGDNIIQLEVERERLKNLTEESELILIKYLPRCKSINLIQDINSYLPGPKNKKRTAFDDFMIELENKKIIKKINQCLKKIKILEDRIKKIEKPLKRIKGYEKKLYLSMLQGNNITQAVKQVAEECEKSERTMWRYAKKLRKILKKYEINDDFEIIF